MLHQVPRSQSARQLKKVSQHFYLFYMAWATGQVSTQLCRFSTLLDVNSSCHAEIRFGVKGCISYLHPKASVFPTWQEHPNASVFARFLQIHPCMPNMHFHGRFFVSFSHLSRTNQLVGKTAMQSATTTASSSSEKGKFPSHCHLFVYLCS